MNYPTIQMDLSLKVEKEVEVNGVGMGVLSDGTPYLTGNGLAALCGVDPTTISRIGAEWGEDVQKPRITAIKNILANSGVVFDSPYFDMNGRSFWVGTVCLAVLEYYTFDATQINREIATRNYRQLAGIGFQNYIYDQVDYHPSKVFQDNWKDNFHDRVSLTYDATPPGFFSVFKETAEMIVTLGQSGLSINDTFVPDISVGQSWAKYWSSNKLAERFGERQQFEHNYPPNYRQAASNPQLTWCYPDAALGEFRKWGREVYIGEDKFKNYLSKKVKDKELPPSFAQAALEVYKR